MQWGTGARTAVAVALVALLGCGAEVTAQTPNSSNTWPTGRVRLLVPFGAGSATDVTARLFADRLSQRWNQSVIVENRPGADSNIAVGAFAQQRDENTLLYSAPNPISVNPSIYDKLPYDPTRDMVPISMGSEIYIIVSVPEQLKLGRLQDLVSLAKAQPGKLNWVATPGVVYFMTAGFLKTQGLDMVQVPYRDFVQAVNDLAEGRIQMTVTSLQTASPQIQAGKVKPLAVTSDKRMPQLPELPTVKEAGAPTWTFGAFGGFFGGRDMPAALVERLSADVRWAGTDAEMAKKLAGAGIAVRTSTPAEFAAAIEGERAKVAEYATVLGTKKQQQQ